MNLELDDFGVLAGFFDESSDALQMSEKAGGVLVAFPAMSDIVIETETVVEALGFRFGRRDEELGEGFESFGVAGLDFEVGNDGDAGIGRHKGMGLFGGGADGF